MGLPGENLDLFLPLNILRQIFRLFCTVDFACHTLNTHMQTDRNFHLLVLADLPDVVWACRFIRTNREYFSPGFILKFIEKVISQFKNLEWVPAAFDNLARSCLTVSSKQSTSSSDRTSDTDASCFRYRKAARRRKKPKSIVS